MSILPPSPRPDKPKLLEQVRDVVRRTIRCRGTGDDSRSGPFRGRSTIPNPRSFLPRPSPGCLPHRTRREYPHHQRKRVGRAGTAKIWQVRHGTIRTCAITTIFRVVCVASTQHGTRREQTSSCSLPMREDTHALNRLGDIWKVLLRVCPSPNQNKELAWFKPGPHGL